MIIDVILKNGGDENSPYSLNVMVNYHYYSENRVITRYFPSMLWVMHFLSALSQSFHWMVILSAIFVGAIRAPKCPLQCQKWLGVQRNYLPWFLSFIMRISELLMNHLWFPNSLYSCSVNLWFLHPRQKFKSLISD